jgi:hypothetical protein
LPVAAIGLVAIGLTTVFAIVWGAAFEAVAFETVAFAAVFAVLSGIGLLLFFEDFVAWALTAARVSLGEVRAELLVALRPAAAAFLEDLLVLFLPLRDLCDTACARNYHAPVR